MRWLPNVPEWLRSGRMGEYLVRLVSKMDRELSERPVRKDGALYVSDEEPLAIVGDDGVTYYLAVEGQKLVITDTEGTEVFGANLAETDQANTFTAANEFNVMPTTGGDAMFESGSNANGEWITFIGGWTIASRIVTPDWANASFQSWDMPVTFLTQPGQFVAMATHTGGGPGNAALDVVRDVSNSPVLTSFRIAFRGTTDATAAGEQVRLTAIGMRDMT